MGHLHSYLHSRCTDVKVPIGHLELMSQCCISQEVLSDSFVCIELEMRASLHLEVW